MRLSVRRSSTALLSSAGALALFLAAVPFAPAHAANVQTEGCEEGDCPIFASEGDQQMGEGSDGESSSGSDGTGSGAPDGDSESDTESEGGVR